MEFENLEEQLVEMKKQVDVLKKVIKPSEKFSLKVDLKNIEMIINKKLPDILEKNAPLNFPKLYFDFNYEYNKFKEFILYEKLIGKNVVALGGGFSSGKSSFLNSLIGKKILPQDINPSTSVPAYIVNGKETYVYGVNVFDSKIEMDVSYMKIISHGFGEVRDDDDNLLNEEITLGHILKSLFLSTPLQIYENIAFLDTPGYSKADTEGYSSRTDEKIAKAQLNSSNYILWFVQADSGTITENDISFLKSLKKDIPKLIIVSKADKKTVSDIEEIVKKIKSVLDVKGIRYVDVLAYSSKKTKEFDHEKLKKYLSDWNTKITKMNFAYNFKILFTKCKEYYDYNIDNENKRLNRLNTALTLSDNNNVTECLCLLINESKRNLESLREIKENLKEIQDEFFTEIKKVADIVGIEMPEPSEIDLLKDKITNPLNVLKELKKNKCIKDNPNLSLIIKELLSDVKPIINNRPGGLGYEEILFKTIKDSLNNLKENIKFNNIYKNSEEY
ncbi:MAG: dynamin family protein [Clostridium sp.]|nr:dynamin family protein [Clostridium sp.]